MTSLHLARFKSPNPRRNLSAETSRKRGESNFLRSFERAYVSRYCRQRQVAWQDFALQGYGIADLVMLSWSAPDKSGTVFSLEQLRLYLRGQRLTAFEVKLLDWRKGLIQGHRYRYFCDRAIVVLPEKTAKIAEANLDLFRSLNVGLWAFHPATGTIRKRFTPNEAEARNLQARDKAIETILAKIQFCKAFKAFKR
jgi:hypothetical protein